MATCWSRDMMSGDVGVVLSASVNIHRISRMLSQWKNKQTIGDLKYYSSFFTLLLQNFKRRNGIVASLLQLCPQEL